MKIEQDEMLGASLTSESPNIPEKPPTARRGDKFEPVDLEVEPTVSSGLPSEIWTIIQSAPANFTPQYFLEVSRNLLENPNLTASHLSRAELSYSSFTDATFNPEATHPHELAKIIKHLKPDHQPLLVPGGVLGYTLSWTAVRKLIPRNPKLDEPLLQTCHLYTSTTPSTSLESKNEHVKSVDVSSERYLIIYLPHVANPDEIPFYHPKVRGVAILFTHQPSLSTSSDIPSGSLSIYYDLFPSQPLDNRLSRTALKMIEIIHKHSRGRMAGYKKRVHHDQIIPQKTFQDTYAYLKGKYAKDLIDGWAEQTPPEKHVFEDLGIAAFLVELWKDLYGGKVLGRSRSGPTTVNSEAVADGMAPGVGEVNEGGFEVAGVSDIEFDLREKQAKEMFPGFVDIGCGNGLLVWILRQEGWKGWGFDARKRKTWATFDTETRECLKEMLLVPEVLGGSREEEEEEGGAHGPATHNGVFPKGMFIVSNHADELTVWTPLLAHLSSSPFIAIPCCSHDFGGTRFRAPNKKEYSFQPKGSEKDKSKQPSAYASLCSYISYLTAEAGFKPEKEHLRIPSTRNVAILGRQRTDEGHKDLAGKLEFLRKVVEREMSDCTVEQVKMQWLKRGSGLAKEKGGH